MEVFRLIGENWFTLLQSVGIIAGLVFTAVSLRRDARARRVANLITLTEHHRQIWAELYRQPELSRVTDPHVNLKKSPVTPEEELLVGLLILHLNAVYRAQASDVMVRIEGMETDVQWFFTLPIPLVVWRKLKPLQDADFVKFVEECRRRSE